jgi:hypothetical protein
MVYSVNVFLVLHSSKSDFVQYMLRKTHMGKYYIKNVNFLLAYIAMHWEFKEQMSKNVKYVKMYLCAG